jgi:hypothetical protein
LDVLSWALYFVIFQNAIDRIANIGYIVTMGITKTCTFDTAGISIKELP